MDITSEKHVDNTLDKIRVIFNRAKEKIDALKPGEKLKATGLSEEIAPDYNLTGAQLYHTLKLLFEDYPGIYIVPGAHGGLFKEDPSNPREIKVKKDKVK